MAKFKNNQIDSIKDWRIFIKTEILCHKKSPFLEIMIFETLSLICEQYGKKKTNKLIERLKLQKFGWDE